MIAAILKWKPTLVLIATNYSPPQIHSNCVLMSRIALPIDSAMDEIVAAVEHHAAIIVEAPPGAGKTTRVAPALMRRQFHERPFGRSHRVVEPRRLAARTAAARIAYEENVELGRDVGYQVRFDRRMTRDTRLVVVTPVILLRELPNDGVLSEVSAVLLDEFS